MAATPISNPPGLIIDANVLIALCSREVDKYAVADAELTRYAQAGYLFYAPGVIVAECLYILCKKLMDGSFSSSDHAAAVADLCSYMGMVLPPPNGDRMLVARAEQIWSGYGCSRSADGLYLALAEDVATMGPAELLAFDAQLPNQAKSNAPSVVIRLLIPSTTTIPATPSGGPSPPTP
jgi:predicted nucleic acid-binding protein